MLHFISGWTKPGGSCEAFINLINALNKHGYDSCFYGTGDYPSSRCNFKKLNQLKFKKEDIVISHFIPPYKFPVKKNILSCHETELFQIKKLNYQIYDKIHYVSKWQKDWHNLDYPHFICSNIIDPTLRKSERKPKEKTAGIIGSIDYNKQTHISIQKALSDGCKMVYLFGNITDENYFKAYVKPLIDRHKNITHIGFLDSKQMMYDLVSDVYQYSLKETFGLVGAECEITGTNYHSNLKNYYIMSEEDIIKTWIKELEL